MIPSPLPRDLKTGILHLGLGAFHRAHQAAFTQDAIAAAGGDWGIEAVAMRNPTLAETLTAQDGVYTLIERQPAGPVFREMTVIRKAHVLPKNVEAVAARLADPAIHVVTITVTEKGYGADLSTRCLSLADPAIAHDLAARSEAPRSLVGLIVLGLALRWAAGAGGLTLMSCDNLPRNGQLLKALVNEFAAKTDTALASWITDNCRFPDSMVDRITPAASAETASLIETALGHSDPAAIETEPFRQWVIENDFAGPRPAWELAGVLIVPDVAPFESMKLRLLNGSHSMIAYLGALAGLKAVRDVMADDTFRSVVRRHMDFAAQTLEPLPDFDLAGYCDALITRFANPAIDHHCLQIAMDGSQKLPQRLFAPSAERLAAGQSVDTFAFAVAGWIRFARGLDDAGGELELLDPMAAAIRAALNSAGVVPGNQIAALASLNGLAHQGVLDDPRFVSAVSEQLEAIATLGAAGAAYTLMGTVRANSLSGAGRRPGLTG